MVNARVFMAVVFSITECILCIGFLLYNLIILGVLLKMLKKD